MIRKALAAAALALGLASGAHAATPWPMGAFVDNPEDGGSQAALAAFTSNQGIAPTILNVYIQGTIAPSAWPGNSSYFAGEFASTSPWNAAGVIPMIGSPMGDSSQSDSANLTYLQQVAAGNYDSMFRGFVDGWSNAGYKTQYWRPGVEVNLTSTPGFTAYVGNPSAWIAAFQRIYTILHQEATSDGVTLKVLWNPGITNGQGDGNPSTVFWPGAAYVDMIAGDMYSNLYPQGGSAPYDWAANGQTYGGGTYDSSIAQFASNPINLEHYYTFPDSNGSGPDASCTNNGNSSPQYSNCGSSFSLYNLIYFAKQQNRPIAFPEIGTDSGNNGPTDNPTLPLWFNQAFQYATSQGVQVDLYSIWNSNGGCNCLSIPTTADGSTTTAASWRANLGNNAPGGTVSASPANTQVNGPLGSIVDSAGNTWTINTSGFLFRSGVEQSTSYTWKTIYWTGSVLYVLQTGGVWDTINLSTGAGTVASAPTGYVAQPAVSPANTQVNGTTGVIYDTFGNAWAINSSQQITVNGTIVASSAGVVTLFWTGTQLDQLNTSNAWYTQPLDGSAGTSIAAPTGYTPPHAASPANTQVNGTVGVIYDTSGTAWTINTNGQIVRGGVVVASSANVTTLFWTGTALDQLNTAGAWYTQPLDGSAGVAIAAPAGYVAPVVSLSGTPPALSSTTAFLSSIGVNVHVSQGTALYPNLTDVEADLAYLGIKNLRDSYNPYWEAYQNSYSKLASASGAKWDFISTVGSNSSPPVESASNVAAFLANVTPSQAGTGGIGYLETEVPGSIYAVEGPNEINNFAISYNTGTTTDTGVQAGVDFQKELYSETKADAQLPGVKVYYFTGYNAGSVAVGPNPGTTTGLADYDNQHPYPGVDNPPLEWVTPSAALGNETAPFGPAVYTETGYNTQNGGITQAAMGAWILDIFADDWYDNISKTYPYQLMSDSTSDGSGFYTSTNTATTAATDLHNFTTLLTDTGANAATYTPTSNITYTLTGTGANAFAVQKSSGETDIIVWNETAAYPGTAATATVTFGSTVATANVFDPTVGTTATATHSSVSSVSLSLTGSPQIIEVTPVASAPPAPTAISIAPASASPIAIFDYNSTNPFTNIAITDNNPSQTETATVSLSNVANGTLSDPNAASDGSTVNNNILTIQGTVAQMDLDLDNLIFAPTVGTVNGTSVTTTVTATIKDTAGQTTSTTSTVTAIHQSKVFNGNKGC